MTETKVMEKLATAVEALANPKQDNYDHKPTGKLRQRTIPQSEYKFIETRPAGWFRKRQGAWATVVAPSKTVLQQEWQVYKNDEPNGSPYWEDVPTSRADRS